MKKFLGFHQFDQPYLGGLSSYSIFVMIVAFLNHCGPLSSPSRILHQFFAFYSTFNEVTTGININGSFFSLSGIQEEPMVIIDPLNPENNLAKNSYKIREIIMLF